MRSQPLSSTIDRWTPDRGAGQTLVIFALSLVVLLGMAALAFDVGQMTIDRRAQQNAADAAALAGARYVALSPCRTTPSLANCPGAVSAALKVAQLNGYGDGATNCIAGCPSLDPKVTVKIPPGPEAVEYYGVAGAVEVQIGSTRSSIFGGALGFSNWTVGAMGVAANQVDVALSYSFLALDPTACPSVLLSGSTGSGLTAGGNVQVDSTCAGGLQVTGNADITVTSGACNVSGSSIATSGHAQVNCTVNTNSPVVPDPLAGLAAPTMPPLAAAPVNTDNPLTSPPANCPSTLAAPATCKFSASYAGTHWRLFPGTYPGGLQLLAGTFYLEPGIYYIAGGGLSAGGNGVTVATVNTGTTTTGGGILIYDTQDAVPGLPCSGAACIGQISLNGAGASITLNPYQSDPYKNIVIFEDRALSVSGTTTGGVTRTPDLVLNGGSSNLNVTGTVYMPLGMVQVNGSNSTAMNTQILAYDFKFNGSGGNMTVGYNAGSFFHLRGSGLVK